MFKNILMKSVAGAAAFGTVLGGAHFATPATPTVSPDFATVTHGGYHCGDGSYPDGIGTSTKLDLGQYMAPFGTRNNVDVTVTSDIAPPPRGRVRVALVGRDWSTTVRLEKTSARTTAARVRLPRRLAAGNTYKVRARYLPACSDYRRSGSVRYYTVIKAPTTATPSAGNIRRGWRPRVHVNVDSTVRVNGGQVAVRLFKDGEMRIRQVVPVRKGEADAVFRKVWGRGRWGVRVRYLGNGNFEPDNGRTSFRVR